ncbi:hypothetical protein EMIT048CA2_20144 [Pseudomonas chlororaphis]
MGAGVLTQGVDQNDGLGLVLFQLAHAGGQFVLRDVQRADDMARGEVLGRTDIDHHALLAVDQRGQFTGAEAAATAAQLVSDQQSQQDDEGADEQVVFSGELNQVSNHQGGSRALKCRPVYTALRVGQTPPGGDATGTSL